MEPWDTCAKEQVHRIGSIQPFGCLIAIDLDSWCIVAVSNNIADWLPFASQEILSQNPGAFLPERLLEVHSKIQQDVPCYIFNVVVDGQDKTLDFSVFRSDHYLIFEGFVAQRLLDTCAGQMLVNARAGLRPLQTLTELSHYTLQLLQQMTDADRILMYRFDEEANGEVIDEFCRDGLTSRFVGLRFPSHDIPPQVRALYLRNPVRLIQDCGSDRIELIVAPQSCLKRAADLDLSFSILRSVSEVHVVYLQNMGVRSSLSLSIILNGKLWGLIVAHSVSQLRFSLAALQFFEILSGLISDRLALILQNKFDRIMTDAQRYLVKRPRVQDGVFGFYDYLESIATGLCRQFKAEKMIYADDTHVNVFPEAAIAEGELYRIAKAFFAKKRSKRIWASTRLAEDLDLNKEQMESYGGLLAIPLAEHQSVCWLLFLRKKIKQELCWGGNPAEGTFDEKKLSPRRSFEAWKEVVKGRSENWSATERELARRIRPLINQAQLQYLMTEQLKADGRAETLSFVLHDLGNAMAAIEGRSYYLTKFSERFELSKLVEKSIGFWHQNKALLVSVLGDRRYSAYQSLLNSMDRHVHKTEEQIKKISRDLKASIDVAVSLLNLNRRYATIGQSTELDEQGISLLQVLQDICLLIPETYFREGGRIYFRGCEGFFVGRLLRNDLLRILLNIVQNAIEACLARDELDEPQIKVSAETYEEHFVLVTVEDNGIGFDPDSKEALLFQGYSHKRGHAGLGLFGCRKILEKVGGDLHIDSAGPNAGAIARVILPGYDYRRQTNQGRRNDGQRPEVENTDS